MGHLHPLRLALVGTVLWSASSAAALDNIDPNNVQAQFAWGENVGWQNAEPKPPGGALPGVLVADSTLTGYLWSENLGWINLSCQNRGTCGAGSYGVVNDSHGHLSGYAWSENVGWIKFAPQVSGTPVGGVSIDPATGIFSGKAWSENVGWINFSFAPGIDQYQVQTSWHEATPTFTPGSTPTVTPAGSRTPGTFTPTITGTRSPSPMPIPLSAPGSSRSGLLMPLLLVMSLGLHRWRRRHAAPGAIQETR